MPHERLLTEFQSHRATLERFCVALEAQLRGALESAKLPVHVVSSRVKAEPSLQRKLARPDKTYQSLWDVTDLIGLRVSTYFDDTVDEVARALTQQLAR